MVRRIAVCCALAIILLASSLASFAGKQNSQFLPLPKSLNLEQIVTAVTQDSTGFIWIGTQSGLFKFDGVDVESFASYSGTKNQFIFSLQVDSKGLLWIGSETGAAIYDPSSSTYSEIVFPNSIGVSPRVFDFEQVTEGMLIASSSGLFLFSGGNTELVSDLDGSVGRSVTLDLQNRVWVGTERNGVYLESSDGFVRFSDLRDVNYIREMLVDRQGNLWVASMNLGTFRVNLETRHVEHVLPGSLHETVRSRALEEDVNGNIWLGSDSGLRRWDKADGSLTHILPEFDFSRVDAFDVVYDLHIDTAGTLWVATYHGVYRYNEHFDSLAFIGTGDTDVGNTITSFADSGTGRVAVGTNKGIALWDVSRGSILNSLDSDTKFDSFVTALEYDSYGRLWIGTYTDGLFQWDGDVFRGPYEISDQLAKHGITDLHEGPNGYLWIATAGSGIYRFNLLTLKVLSFPDESNPQGSFPDLKCLAIEPNVDGRFWIATNDAGPFLFDPESGDTINFPAKLERIAQSLSLGEDVVWLGAYTGTLSKFSWREGVISNPLPTLKPEIRAIYGLEMLSDKLLLADQGRILVFDVESGDVRIMDERHNIVSDIVHGATIQLSTGEVLFGGKQGFNVLTPSDVLERKYKYLPRVELSNLQINHEANVEFPRSKLELGYFENDLLITYLVTDYLYPEKIQSAYKLEGFDRDWIDNGTSRNIIYTNLDPGSYVLRVKATNSDGAWSPNELALPINIYPPWWATWWAYTLYAFSALLLFYQLLQLSARRVSVRAEQRFNQRLKHYVSALDDASECVFNASESGRILYVNDAIREVLGKTVSDAIGHSLFEVLFDLEAQKTQALDTLHRDGRFLGEIEQEGKVLEVSIREGEASVEDKVAFVCVVRDVTTRSQQARHLEAEIENLTAELGRVSNDLEGSVAKSAEFQAEAEKRLRQDETLLKSFHDRINDNFQMLSSLFSIQAARSSDGVIADLLDENQQRLKAVGLVHEQLLQTKQLSHVAMADYVDVLATSLYRRLAPTSIQLELIKELSPVQLSIEQAVPAGLILNELVSNALIHAFKDKSHGTGKLKVSFYELAGECVILISDDGQGLSQNFQAESDSGVGFEIVSILTQQLDGSFKRVGGIGTTFEVRFPIVSST